MTWKQKTICRILLIIANMLADPELRKELHSLHYHISTVKQEGGPV